MQANYRQDYPGEFVIVNTIWKDGKKDQQREWIPNPIDNQHISGRAVCIGSLHDRHLFDYKKLERHRGGLLGSKKVQTYGTGQIAHDMRLDFAVEHRADCLPWFIETDYCDSTVTYTTAKNCIRNPGKFYLIPKNPNLLNITTPVYLAAFDGHTEIFLFGYNCDTPELSERWVPQLTDLFQAYRGVKFYLIGEPTNSYSDLLSCSNVSTMQYREWISYADV